MSKSTDLDARSYCWWYIRIVVRLILIWAFWKEDPKGKIFISGVLVTFMVQLSTSIVSNKHLYVSTAKFDTRTKACAVALQGIGPLYGRDPDKDQYGCFLVFQKGSWVLETYNSHSCYQLTIILKNASYVQLRPCLSTMLYDYLAYIHRAHRTLVRQHGVQHIDMLQHHQEATCHAPLQGYR